MPCCRWTTITSRARAQQFWYLEKQRRERNQEARRQASSETEDEKWWHRGQRMLNSSLYAISMQSHFQLGSHTVLSANGEADSVQSLFPGTRGQNLPGESERRGPQNPWHGRFSLRHKVIRSPAALHFPSISRLLLFFAAHLFLRKFKAVLHCMRCNEDPLFQS